MLKLPRKIENGTRSAAIDPDAARVTGRNCKG